MSQVHIIMFKKTVPVLFQCFKKALEQHYGNLFELILQTSDIVCWGFPDSPLQYGHYIQQVIVFE